MLEEIPAILTLETLILVEMLRWRDDQARMQHRNAVCSSRRPQISCRSPDVGDALRPVGNSGSGSGFGFGFGSGSGSCSGSGSGSGEARPVAVQSVESMAQAAVGPDAAIAVLVMAFNVLCAWWYRRFRY